jgi:hypothetical protein
MRDNNGDRMQPGLSLVPLFILLPPLAVARPIAVGNLSYDLTEQDVIEHFNQAGPVKHVR